MNPGFAVNAVPFHFSRQNAAAQLKAAFSMKSAISSGGAVMPSCTQERTTATQPLERKVNSRSSSPYCAPEPVFFRDSMLWARTMPMMSVKKDSSPYLPKSTSQ